MTARGIRNNNPGNIEYGAFARKLGATGSDGRFAIFPDAATGIRAIVALQRSYEHQGLRSAAARIGKWAPSSENNTAAYAKRVADGMGIDPNTPFSIDDPQKASAFVKAMIGVENGKQPYGPEVIDAAVGSAGTALPTSQMAGGIDASSPDYWRPETASQAASWESGAKPATTDASDPIAYALAAPIPQDSASAPRQPMQVGPVSDKALSRGLFGLANRSRLGPVQNAASGLSGLSGLFGLNPRNIGSAAPIGGTPTDAGVRTMAEGAGYATSAATPDGYTAPTFDKRLGGSTYAYKYDPVTKKGTYINEFGRLIHYGG